MSSLDHVANAFCLEVANSVNGRVDTITDWFADPSSYAVWVASFPDGAAPVVTAAQLERLVDLRESIYRVISAIAADTEPAETDLAQLVSHACTATSAASLTRGSAAFELVWPQPWSAPSVGHRAAIDAVELLRSSQIDRLGECPSCRWLFVDTSKNGRRKWCSMDMCGSRSKAKSYYQRRVSDATSKS